jgi:hypothetical protein
MPLSAYDVSAAVFVRGLSNLTVQLKKAEAHAAAGGSGEAGMLNAMLAADGAAGHPRDLHRYPLAAHVHWAAEGPRIAIGRVLGAPAVPATQDAKSFAELLQHVDATIAYLRAVPPTDVEAGLDRPIVIEHPRGTMRSVGSHFLVAFAVPHFFYHLTAAYSILRNQGVELTMSEFLGNWPQQ